MQTETQKVYRPYALLALMGLLVMFSGLFLRAGAEGMSLWVLAAAICAALLARSVARLRLEHRDEDLAKLLAATFAVVFLMGEFGASTDSRLSFAVSIWRVGMLVFLCVVLRKESMEGHPTFQKLVGSSLGAYFGALLVAMWVTILAQWLFMGNGNIKGIVRFATYYGSLAVSLYCAL